MGMSSSSAKAPFYIDGIGQYSVMHELVKEFEADFKHQCSIVKKNKEIPPFFKNEWKVSLNCAVSFGDLYVDVMTKGRRTIYLLNDGYDNSGVKIYTIFSKNRLALEEFIADFNIKRVRIKENLTLIQEL